MRDIGNAAFFSIASVGYENFERGDSVNFVFACEKNVLIFEIASWVLGFIRWRSLFKVSNSISLF